jgi:hypothetical protein
MTKPRSKKVTALIVEPGADPVIYSPNAQAGVEQPHPTTPTESVNAPTVDKVDTAEGPGPVPEASPSGEAPSLELTPATLAQVINQLSQNENVIMAELKRLRDEVSSMRGGYSAKRVSDPAAVPAPGAPQTGGEMPQMMQQLIPVGLAALGKFLNGPEEKPKSKISELIEAKLMGRIDAMMDQALNQVSESIDASMEGRLFIQPKENSKTLEAPK